MRKAVMVVAGLALLGWFGTQSPQETAEPDPPPVESTETDRTRAEGTYADPRETETETDRHRGEVAEGDGPRQAEDTKSPSADRAPAPRPRRHRVVEVVDGDTVTVAARGSVVSVRVIGIDTPETVHPSEPVECGGPSASATAARLLAGKRVRLVFDPSQGRTDSYGRTLAYVQAPGVGDFGLAMIRRGRAAEYTYDSAYARQARYLVAQRRARSLDRGIWGGCGGVDTPRGAQQEPVPRPRVREGGGDCATGYDPCLPPYPPDLDCADLDGPVRVSGDDPHGFDADGDGTGCDS